MLPGAGKTLAIAILLRFLVGKKASPLRFAGDGTSATEIRRGCSQSEFQFPNLGPCSEECGEVFSDKFKPIFPGGKLSENLPPKIHHIFHSQNFKISSP